MSRPLTAPCDNCPFLREGGIRITPGRVRQIAGMMLSPHGGSFPCHKTIGHEAHEEQHCAGAMIFADKNNNHTQIMRILGRLGFYDPDKMVGKERVFDTLKEMLLASRSR